WTILRGPSYDTFTTAFKRGGSLSFSCRQAYWHDRSVSGAVDDPHLSDELSALYGVTRGVSALVPRLLGFQPGRWTVAALSKPAQRSPARIRDRTCYVISGTHGPERYTLSIDSATFELIRVRIDSNATNSTCTIDYWPKLMRKRESS